MIEEKRVALSDSFYSDRASLSQLIQMSRELDIPLNLVSPSTVTISGLNSTVKKPYSLKGTVGALSFFNINYSNTNVETLYLGTVKTAYTALLENIPESTRVGLEVFYDTSEQSYYVKLGKNAVVESVQLTSQNNTGLHLYHSFKQISASPTALQFKLKRGYDQSLNLYFGVS